MNATQPFRFRATRRTLLVAIACLLPAIAPPPVRGQAPAPLHLVSTAWPPFTNAPGQARFALDLVEEALKRIGATAETAIVEDPTLLLTGPYDGSAAVWRDAEREKALLFSEPYLENRLILVGRRGSDVSSTTLAALAGKRIVLVAGYAYGDAVTGKPGPTLLRSRSEEDSLAKLLAGEADYTLMDELVVQYILTNHGEQARTRLQVGSTPLVTRTLHFAIRRERPEAASLISRFNAELRKMVADRTYHRLLRVDWIEADVDGDGRKELISRSDQAGTAPPERSYSLFAAASKPRPAAEPPAGPRFYFGGTVYETWTAVPPRYKVMDPSKPDASRSGGTIFRFVW